MNVLPEKPGPPHQLEDALTRLEEAKADYSGLAVELEKFLCDYYRSMLKGFDKEKEIPGFTMQLRHPRESAVRGRPAVLASRIVESLRTVLDYMVFQLSTLNGSEVKERVPQFVITNSRERFEKAAKTQLKYLTPEQQGFIEQIQPYNGNGMLPLLDEMAGRGKHRRLLSLLDITGFDIYFAEITKKDEYQDCYFYPVGRGSAVFAKPRGTPVFLLLEKYDAMQLLGHMINHVDEIIRSSYCFFEGRPLELKIVK